MRVTQTAKKKALIGAFSADSLFLRSSVSGQTLRLKDGQFSFIGLSIEGVVADNESLVPLYEGDTLEITF